MICGLWNGFSRRFQDLWSAEAGIEGLTAASVFGDDNSARAAVRSNFMKELFYDALRFAGCSMIRRLIGIAHNADFERIKDVDVKAKCELRALQFGRMILVEGQNIASIESLCEAATEARKVDSVASKEP